MPAARLSNLDNSQNVARAERANQRARRMPTPPIQKMTFRLSPYDAILDLSKNYDRKMYLEAAKGLKEANLFTGENTDFFQFSKLMDKAFRDVRVIECLLTPSKWDTTNIDTELQKLPITTGLLNQFVDNKVTKEQVQAKSKLV